MNQVTEFINDPLILIAAAVVVLLLLVLLFVRRRPAGVKAQERRLSSVRTLTIQKLRAADSFRLLDMREQDAQLVMNIVSEDGVKLEGKFKRATMHIQSAAYARDKTTLNEDQITEVLVAYTQAQAEVR